MKVSSRTTMQIDFRSTTLGYSTSAYNSNTPQSIDLVVTMVERVTSKAVWLRCDGLKDTTSGILKYLSYNAYRTMSTAGQWPMRPDFWPKWPANLDTNDIYMGTISIFVSDKCPYCVLLYQSGQCIGQ